MGSRRLLGRRARSQAARRSSSGLSSGKRIRKPHNTPTLAQRAGSSATATVRTTPSSERGFGTSRGVVNGSGRICGAYAARDPPRSAWHGDRRDCRFLSARSYRQRWLIDVLLESALISILVV